MVFAGVPSLSSLCDGRTLWGALNLMGACVWNSVWRKRMWDRRRGKGIGMGGKMRRRSRCRSVRMRKRRRNKMSRGCVRHGMVRRMRGMRKLVRVSVYWRLHRWWEVE